MMAGADAAKLLAQHYMRLHIDAERVTRTNLRLWDPRLTAQEVALLIAGAKKAKTPSAAQLGKQWRVTVGEVASLGLSTITAFSVTLEADRVRQRIAAGEMPTPRRNAAVRSRMSRHHGSSQAYPGARGSVAGMLALRLALKFVTLVPTIGE
jgi:hypothetical protein